MQGRVGVWPLMTVPSFVAEVLLLSTWLAGLPSSYRSRGVSPGGKSCPGEISPKEGTSIGVVLVSKQQGLLETGEEGREVVTSWFSSSSSSRSSGIVW